MSVRRRLAGTATVVAATAASAALALLPGTANAATQSTTANPLTITATPAQPGPLLPGGAAKSFDFTVTNHSGAAIAMNGELSGAAHGALPLTDGDVKLSVRAVHAPATTSVFGSQDGGFIGSFYPKGGHWGSTFKLPAHSSYTWKITVAATKAFPINDDRLEIGFGAVADKGRNVAERAMPFHIGAFNLHNGGPIVTEVSGGKSLTAKQPLTLDVSFTNRTGLPLAKKVYPWIGQGSRSPLSGVTLAYDLWDGKRWVSLGKGDAALPVLPAHMANGATVHDKVRVRIAGWNNTARSGQIQLEVAYDGFYGAVVKNLQAAD
ncbi:hypothetical protein ACFYZJ_37645 [Streptomyces sp. NPDC001848]|uniref:hypothetical protein n=1 Tax=Streptomyces sp. NPDC001848 TaxID=3364618 RepID=UPI003684E9A6